MKLYSLTLKNFRGYKDETKIVFDDLTAIVGRNDIGKSSILEALDIFCNSKPVHPLEKSDINVEAVANVYVLPETSRFTVARKHNSTNTTIAIVEVLGTLGSLYGNPGLSNPSPYTATLSSNTTEYEVFRAADYYFSDSHLLSSGITLGETGILILAHDDAFGTTLGSTNTVNNTINIYNAGTDMEETIATTLHEIGHIRHCQKNPNLYNNSIDQFVRESYASFVGWALGEQYV